MPVLLNQHEVLEEDSLKILCYAGKQSNENITRSTFINFYGMKEKKNLFGNIKGAIPLIS